MTSGALRPASPVGRASQQSRKMEDDARSMCANSMLNSDVKGGLIFMGECYVCLLISDVLTQFELIK
jgi:hypothetical protein